MSTRCPCCKSVYPTIESTTDGMKSQDFDQEVDTKNLHCKNCNALWIPCVSKTELTFRAAFAIVFTLGSLPVGLTFMKKSGWIGAVIGLVILIGGTTQGIRMLSSIAKDRHKRHDVILRQGKHGKAAVPKQKMSRKETAQIVLVLLAMVGFSVLVIGILIWLDILD